ncbi:MAG: PRC-barrel domain containing protein [wastewater metagenome]|nr:PRC-barrel domain containing protein [Candidatus Loosdrechtia aerotolerans]
MLRSIKSLYGYRIHAVDGDIGRVCEFLFDDKAWIIRYLVVDTSSWLPGRKVLIPPGIVKQSDLASEIFPVVLNKEEVENSPDITTEKPVSLQHQMELYKYYGPLNRPREGYYNVPPFPPPEREGDPHLRSTEEIIGYRIHATDGDIGHVDDFILDVKDWIIRHMVVDTGSWLPGRKVLISSDWITHIRWRDERVYVDIPKDIIKDSPEYDPSVPANRQYEIRLYDYYGRPKYWS